VVAFIVWGLVSVDTLSAVSTAVLGGLMTGGGWAFVLVAGGFVVFALWVAFSRYGRIPLGGDDEGPEFRTVSWIAMMFSAGMGIGLMFYGVSEPLSHFTSPPPGTVAAGSPEALDVAMATTLFHWTLRPWAIYAVVGLAIAYSTFRRGRRQLISSAFAPPLLVATGIQNITIIMAAPFAVVMVVLCVALARDLHDDPMMRRDRRSAQAVEQAVDYGTTRYGDRFVVSVKQHPDGESAAGPPGDGRT
jgi:choline-glycine betaine transporter